MLSQRQFPTQKHTTREDIHTRTHSLVHTHSHTQSMHTRMHTRMHTHMHTHTTHHAHTHTYRYEGKHAVADGKRALNLLSHDFLNLANTPEVLVSHRFLYASYSVTLLVFYKLRC